MCIYIFFSLGSKTDPARGSIGITAEIDIDINIDTETDIDININIETEIGIDIDINIETEIDIHIHIKIETEIDIGINPGVVMKIQCCDYFCQKQHHRLQRTQLLGTWSVSDISWLEGNGLHFKSHYLHNKNIY